MAALDGLGFANYAIGMGERGKDFLFQQAERVRAQIEREKAERLREEARVRNERVFANLGGEQAPQMGLRQSPQPQPMQQGPQPIARGGLAAMIGQVGQRSGLPSGYLERTAQLESGMNPNARNPKSSAKGLFQFIDGTAKEYGLTNPMDPMASTEAAARYAQNSARILKSALGRDPTAGELYLAHQQGAQTAARLLRNPNAPVTQVMGRQAILLNGGTPNMTAGQFAQKWLTKFGNVGQPQGVQMASAGPVQLPSMQQQAQAPQMAPQAPQMPGANIPTEQLIAVLRDPGSSDEDKKIAAMLLEPRFADPLAQDFKRAQIAQMQRETALLGQPKPQELPSDVREYQFAQSQGYKGTFSDWQLQNRRAGATNVNMGGGTDKQIFDAMNESAVAARSAAQGLSAIRTARNAVQSGGIFGAGADARLGLAKIGQLLGVDNAATIQNTEMFRSAIAPQVAALMKATVGSTQISNADREFAEKAAGGSIALDPGSILRLLNVMERANEAIVAGHVERMNTVYPDPQGFQRERALFNVAPPSAPRRIRLDANGNVIQ